MGHIFVKSGILSFTGYAIYRVVENSAPTVEITRQAFAAPHPERGVTFSPLNPVMHQVQLWESSDGTTLDTLRVTIDLDASVNNELQVTIFEIVVGRGNAGLTVGDTGDPEPDTDTYLDARMKDQVYQITQRGFGPLRPDEYTDQSAGQGGFQLVGNVFVEADTYFISVFRKTTITATPASADTDIKLVGSDETIDTTYYNKLIIPNATGTLQTLTFPAFSTIPDLTRISFSTQYGTYNYLKLQCAGSDSIRFIDAVKTAIFLSRNERIDLIFKGGYCYILNYDGRAGMRGNTYGDVMARAGTVQANGTEYTKAQMAGLWDWLINEAPVSLKCTYAEYDTTSTIDTDVVYTNRGLFAVDLIGETFKVPNVAGSFERYILPGDTTRFPNSAGGYQHDQLHAHSHGYNPGDQQGLSDNANDRQVMIPGSTSKTTNATGALETNPVNRGKIPLIIL